MLQRVGQDLVTKQPQLITDIKLLIMTEEIRGLLLQFVKMKSLDY